ncbi:alpha/beta hydrolase [Tistrella bauzanensis]|uniref:Alpha/beta hydrolase n=1 Tax=Tistrella arctica TaxID=3133430 RepID=A0ABU9YF50_9PROT
MITEFYDKNFIRRRITVDDGTTINLVSGGKGPPLLLLHGYPESHVMWHRVAPLLAPHFELVIPDLRGYGDSDKPAGDEAHARYSKRRMALDMAQVMTALGHERFSVAGHDRGARVTHRLLRDHEARVVRASVMDIVPTLDIYEATDRTIATSYFHWFFLIQDDGLPERLIAGDPGYLLDWALNRLCVDPAAIGADEREEYKRWFVLPETIHATCEDYRAGATIDLDHDRADRDHRLSVPLLVLWGAHRLVGKRFDPLAIWRQYATTVEGEAIDCGHFLPEEAPEAVAARMIGFFGA